MATRINCMRLWSSAWASRVRIWSIAARWVVASSRRVLRFVSSATRRCSAAEAAAGAALAACAAEASAASCAATTGCRGLEQLFRFLQLQAWRDGGGAALRRLGAGSHDRRLGLGLGARTRAFGLRLAHALLRRRARAGRWRAFRTVGCGDGALSARRRYRRGRQCHRCGHRHGRHHRHLGRGHAHGVDAIVRRVGEDDELPRHRPIAAHGQVHRHQRLLHHLGAADAHAQIVSRFAPPLQRDGDGPWSPGAARRHGPRPARRPASGSRRHPGAAAPTGPAPGRRRSIRGCGRSPAPVRVDAAANPPMARIAMLRGRWYMRGLLGGFYLETHSSTHGYKSGPARGVALCSSARLA